MNKAAWMLIAAVVMWGSTIAPTKWALESLPPITLAFLRLVFGSLLFLPLAWLQAKRRGQLTRIPWMRMCSLSFTGIAGYFVFAYWGIALTSGVHASILAASLPLFTILLAVAFLKERVLLQQWIGLALGVAGVLIISVQPGADAGSSLLGDVLVLGSCLVFAVYVVQLKRPGGEARLPSELFTALTLAIGAVLLAPLSVMELWNADLPPISPKAWGSLVYLVIGPTILAYWLWNKGLEQVSAGSAGVYMNMLPLVSVVTAIVCLGEALTLRSFVGGVLILSGVFWSEHRRTSLELAPAEKLEA